MADGTDSWHEIFQHLKTKLLNTAEGMHPQLQFLTSSPSSEDICLEACNSGGLVNTIFRIKQQDTSENQVIVKYATPSQTFRQDRNVHEFRALKKFNEVCPNTAPEIYLNDEERYFYVMQDLHDFTLFNRFLADGSFSTDMLLSISSNLAKIHKRTHRKFLSTDNFNRLKEEFPFGHMQNFVSKSALEMPVCERQSRVAKMPSRLVAKQLDHIYEDKKLQANAKDLINLYKSEKDCLIHGDFHAGSVLFKSDTMKIIDAEFSFIGCQAIDLGLFVANVLAFYYILECEGEQNRDKMQRIVEGVKAMIDNYVEMAEIDDVEVFLQNLAGFAGIEIIERIITSSTYPELLAAVEYAEADALQAGIRLLSGMRNIQTSDRLVFIALTLC